MQKFDLNCGHTVLPGIMNKLESFLPEIVSTQAQCFLKDFQRFYIHFSKIDPPFLPNPIPSDNDLNNLESMLLYNFQFFSQLVFEKIF